MFDNIRTDIKVYRGAGSSWLELPLIQGFHAVVQYRFANWVHYHFRIPVLRQALKIFCILWQKWIEITCGVCIPAKTRIGKGLFVGHFGGIIIHPHVQIGDYFGIMQGVTIGYGGNGPDDKNGGVPVIGDKVYFAPGSKALGKMCIGDRAHICANAVVTKDVPDDAMVGGVPAKIIKMRDPEDAKRPWHD